MGINAVNMLKMEENYISKGSTELVSTRKNKC
jgi:hypothetical protein